MKAEQPDANSVGEILAQILGRFGSEEQLGEIRYDLAWQSIVGPALFKHSMIVKIENNQLIVAVSDATWLQSMFYMRGQILAHCRSEPLLKQITDIVFELHPALFPQEYDRTTPKENSHQNRFQQLSEEETAEIRSITQTIENPLIRQKLERIIRMDYGLRKGTIKKTPPIAVTHEIPKENLMKEITYDIVALCSGGLDSLLAVTLMKQQGLSILAVHYTHLYISKHESAIAELSTFLQQVDIPLRVVDITKELTERIINPHYGHGKRLNPCIDCHILMLQNAAKIMQEVGARCIVSGEVLGQRPMSQVKNTMRLIEKQSELHGRLLRPLSAQLLPPTEVEESGLVDRSKLYDFRGRSRKMQIKLAKELGITRYPSPGGGCLLTDKGFAHRIDLYLRYFGELSLDIIHLMRLGRHLIFQSGAWLVIGRDEHENEQLVGLAHNGDTIIEPVEIPGASGLIMVPGTLPVTESDMTVAARIVARYGKAQSGQIVTMQLKQFPRGVSILKHVTPEADEAIQPLLITHDFKR